MPTKEEHFPESDILREINRVHGQYAAGSGEGYPATDSPGSRSASRPVTAKRERVSTSKKRMSVEPMEQHSKTSPEGYRDRVSSFSTRPVLHEIGASATPLVDPKTITSLAAFKISVIGESSKSRKGKEAVSLIFSITDLKNPRQEYWKCEKMYSDLGVLDMKLRQFHAQYIEKMPDKSVFSEKSNRPFEARRKMFDAYVESIREFVPGDKDFVAFFTSDCDLVEAVNPPSEKDTSNETAGDSVLNEQIKVEVTSQTTDTLEAPAAQPTPVTIPPESKPVDINKKAYLAKKGKGQNGYTWKRRYFALRNGLMDCLEKARSTFLLIKY